MEQLGESDFERSIDFFFIFLNQINSIFTSLTKTLKSLGRLEWRLSPSFQPHDNFKDLRRLEFFRNNLP
ncbi:hypothetical protein BpHYR1_018691 [Brachionus plicatilis]|uniref:Uncharacterized protein n=1 Tax=Brachionus plicatilis TaxID=10195 RepID=A0A3M7S636_BRAPC|nr:hypothetical protein BpHYR1_018691 [Brachionus plicatilis]